MAAGPYREGGQTEAMGDDVAGDDEIGGGALDRPAGEHVAVLDPATLRRCRRAPFDEHRRLINSDGAVGEIADRRAADRFEGYYDNPVADREPVRDGWYSSGDLGYLDEGGFLYFAGRARDWVRVDSENLSTRTVELILRRHPGVLAAAAFGVPDPVAGDQLMAGPSWPACWTRPSAGPAVAPSSTDR